MGTVISAASAAAPPAGCTADTSVRLAAQAAKDCLAQAGLPPEGVGVLMNVGVYREHNTLEPAMAALVQKEVGINLDYLANPVSGAGFSFDLMNGACGVLNAVQVAQALLGSGSTDRVLVTAADVHPGGWSRLDDAYPYADLGAALLLERSADDDSGFGPVRIRGGRGASAVTGYLDTTGMGTDGRRLITVATDEDRTDHLLGLAADTVTGYALDEKLPLDRTLLVCNQPIEGFAAGLARRLGMDPAGVVTPGAPDTADGEPHTAAPVLGYLQAVQDGLPGGYERLLFVLAGAGPSVACASYRPQGR